MYSNGWAQIRIAMRSSCKCWAHLAAPLEAILECAAEHYARTFLLPENTHTHTHTYLEDTLQLFHFARGSQSMKMKSEAFFSLAARILLCSPREVKISRKFAFKWPSCGFSYAQHLCSLRTVRVFSVQNSLGPSPPLPLRTCPHASRTDMTARTADGILFSQRRYVI